ncbi:MAG: PEP-CTERM sorting domain-containing protein [Cyanobacteria bacterium P01_D01_bin.73]
MKTSNLFPALAIGLTSAVTVGLAAPEAQAASIMTYDLGSHRAGGIASPYYGLRLDGLMDEGDREGDKYTFDFDHAMSSMVMTYDMDAGTINISGNAYGGADANAASNSPGDAGDGYIDGTTDVAVIDFTYTQVTQPGNDIVRGDIASVNGDDGGYGTGTLSFGGTDFLLRAKGTEGSPVNYFNLTEGYRTEPGLVGWGWLQYSFDEGETWHTGGVSDWLFTADKRPVPEPGMIFGLLGLGAVTAVRRKLSAKA